MAAIAETDQAAARALPQWGFVALCGILQRTSRAVSFLFNYLWGFDIPQFLPD
jgi:hypothetical protein